MAKFGRGGRTWRLWPVVASLSIVGGACIALWAIYRRPAEDQGRLLAFLGFAATVAFPIVAAAVRWLWARPSRPEETTLADELELADRLAAAVKVQWTRAAAEHRLFAPAPIPVRWKRSALPVAGPVAAAIGSMGETAFLDPLPGLEATTEAQLRAGGLNELHKVYGTLGSGRLIILGTPGSGKTGTAILLLLDALRHRQRMPEDQRVRVPVPVFFTLAGWDPAAQRLENWIVAQLQRTYDLFDLRNSSGVRRLLSDGQLAVILDGLDELPQRLRPVALRALSEQATFRIVVLTRSQELVSAAASHHLIGAVALELQPVTARRAASYLSSAQLKPLPQSWQGLIEYLPGNQASTVTRALSTPLMLTLLRDTYSAQDDPSELLDNTRFSTADDIEEHLLARVLPTAYTPDPGAEPPRYTLAQAEEAFSYIAWRMDLDRTRDLAWWAIPQWVPAAPRMFAAGLVSGLSVGLVLGLTFGLAFGAPVGTRVGSTIGVLTGLVAAAACRHGGAPRRLGSLRGTKFLSRPMLLLEAKVALAAGLAGGLLFGLLGGVAWGVWFGLSLGIAFGLATAFAVGLGQPGAEDTSPADPLASWRNDRTYGLVAGVVAGLVAGLMFGLPIALWELLTLGPGAGAESALGFGLTFGLIASTTYLLLYPRTWVTLLASLQLHRANRVPIRFMRFLEEARSLHVLRTVGPVYQFRHARLQGYLARQRGTPHAAPSAAEIVRSPDRQEELENSRRRW